MPLVAAVRDWMPCAIASLRVERSLARFVKDCAWKYFTASSVAEATARPVAKWPCVVPNWVLMFCNASKFCCVAEPRTMLDMYVSF